MGPAGLYLHIPFCFHKCHYCDFYSIVESPSAGQDRQAQLVDALIRELRHHQARLGPLRPRTLFVGGGTPTLLRPELWQRLLQALHDMGALEQAAEFTVEANPETVTPDLMSLLVRGGVNRVSIGAQSFQPPLLEALERHHQIASVPRAVQAARQAGIDNINLDLIFAIPGQTMAQLDADLDAALALEPTHLSCYNLIFEPATPLTQKMKLGQIQPLEEDLQRAMYDRVMTRLEHAGYEHYEISNWARQRADGSYRCLHNLIYWHNLDWLGVGPSAASHIRGRRWKNVPHLGRYLAGSPAPPTQDMEEPDPARHVSDSLMLGLRLRDGIALAWLDHHLDRNDPRWGVIDELIALGMLQRDSSRLRLTRQGLFVADSIIARLM